MITAEHAFVPDVLVSSRVGEEDVFDLLRGDVLVECCIVRGVVVGILGSACPVVECCWVGSLEWMHGTEC